MPPNYSFVTQRHRLGLLAESAEYELVKEGRIPDQFQANLMKPLHSLVKVEKTLKSLTFPTNNLASGSHPIHVLVSASSRSKGSVYFRGLPVAWEFNTLLSVCVCRRETE